MIHVNRTAFERADVDGRQWDGDGDSLKLKLDVLVVGEIAEIERRPLRTLLQSRPSAGVLLQTFVVDQPGRLSIDVEIPCLLGASDYVTGRAHPP